LHHKTKVNAGDLMMMAVNMEGRTVTSSRKPKEDESISYGIWHLHTNANGIGGVV
jgi:hypothetical protein